MEYIKPWAFPLVKTHPQGQEIPGGNLSSIWQRDLNAKHDNDRVMREY